MWWYIPQRTNNLWNSLSHDGLLATSLASRELGNLTEATGEVSQLEGTKMGMGCCFHVLLL